MKNAALAITKIQIHPPLPPLCVGQNQKQMRFEFTYRILMHGVQTDRQPPHVIEVMAFGEGLRYNLVLC